MTDRAVPFVSLFERLADSAGDAVSTEAASRSGARGKAIRILQQELGALLNTHNLEARVDLSKFEQVRRSVLNYGMPALSGRAATSVDVGKAAERIQRAVEVFEPRLKQVTVQPQKVDPTTAALRFRIEGEMRDSDGVVPLVLETEIALDSGDVSVSASRVG